MKKLIHWALDSAFRSPRVRYDPINTVWAITDPSGGSYFGTQIQFRNEFGNILTGTIWSLFHSPLPKIALIFLHSLGTNQYECMNLIPFMVSQEIALVSFDFPGCGISEGDNIPLDGSGDQNVTWCANFLRAEYGFTDFVLWGRSLGASISLQTASKTTDFKCIVADSGFSSTNDIIHDLATRQNYPNFLANILLKLAKKETRNYIGVDLIPLRL